MNSRRQEPISTPPVGERENPHQSALGQRKNAWIAVLSMGAVAVHFVLRFAAQASPGVCNVPLDMALVGVKV